MITHKERYIVDEQGERVEVILDVGEYHKMLDDLEELEAIRAFDAAKMSNDEAIPFEQALAGDRAKAYMIYSVVILRRAQKELADLAGDVYPRVRDALLGLAQDPRPPGYIKLVGREVEKGFVSEWVIIAQFMR